MFRALVRSSKVLVRSVLVIAFLALATNSLLSTAYASHLQEAGLPPGNFCEGNSVVSEDTDGNHKLIEDCSSGTYCDKENAACVSTTGTPENLGPAPAGLNEIENVFDRVIRYSVGIAFVVLVFVLIWAGFRYMTSGGDPKIIQSAALTITWGILGIVFLIVAWLVLLLIEAFTGVKVTVFDFKFFCINSEIPGCP